MHAPGRLLPLSLLALTPALTAQAEDALSAEESLARRRTPVVEVVERAKPAVVSIDANPERSRSFFASPSASGTGVVLYEEGIIVTNYHVVAPWGTPATELLVRFDPADDSRPYTGRLISADPENDLALVKIDGDAPFPTVELSTDEPLLGEPAIAIGNAVGLSHTVSTGIISGLHRDLDVPERNLHFESLIQTDAAINHGNSGGPLLDVNGKLIGINTVITAGAENIGYAIPAARVVHVLEQHLLNPQQAQAYLGCTIDEETFRVREVLPGGPADLAGLRAGDRVVGFDGKRFADTQEYRRQVLSVTAGREVRVAVEGTQGPREVVLVAWDGVSGKIHRLLGITVQRVLFGRQRLTYYLQLTGVDPEGPAGRIGLEAGDVIAAIRAPRMRPARFERARDLAFLLARLPQGTVLDVEIFRDDDGDGVIRRDQSVSELYRGKVTLR